MSRRLPCRSETVDLGRTKGEARGRHTAPTADNLPGIAPVVDYLEAASDDLGYNRTDYEA